MRSAAALAIALAAWPAIAATSWRVDPAASRLTFTAVQAGARFSGRFTRFDAQIDFDGANPSGSRFAVRVATASADTYDEQRDSVLRGPDFFRTRDYPQALFVTDEFAAADGEWTAAGSLTLRGVTRSVPLRFRFLKLPDGGARLEGSTVIRRLDFGVGQGEWADTKWVGNDVEIAFSLALRPAVDADR